MCTCTGNRGLAFAMVLVLAGLWPVAPVHAQNVTLPGAADPSRAFQNRNEKGLAGDSLSAPDAEKKAIAPAPEGSENLKFFLKDITIENMTAYPAATMHPIYARDVGHEISVARLFEIVAAIQQKYLDDGYALTKVTIPNQEIAGGHVRLAVIEGYVGEVQMDERFLHSYVLDDAVRRIRAMKPLNVKTLERIMLIVNDLPDLDASAVLAKPSQALDGQNGAVKLVLEKNENREQRASVTVDNHGSVFTGPFETKINGRLFHVGPNYSALDMGGAAAVPFNEQKSAYASYTLPLFGASGTTAQLRMDRAVTHPGASLRFLDIKGLSSEYNADIYYPVIRRRDQTLRVGGGFSYKNAQTKLLGEEFYDDRLRVVYAYATYNLLDSYAGYNSLYARFSKGLDILGAHKTGSDNLSREQGQSDFRKMEFTAGRIQALPRNFELYTVLNGQYTNNPLLSSEEFGFGGAQMGRGYDPSEITGDRGIAASVELRYNLRTDVWNKGVALQPYVFYDIGKVWNIDPGAKDKISAASTGLGLRADIANDWTTDLNVAAPLTKSAENGPKYQDGLGARVLFSLTRRF